MADILLSYMLQGEMDHEIVTSAIKNGSSIKFKDIIVPLSDFIPHFLEYLREKLSISTSKNYLSPRQLTEKKKKVELHPPCNGNDTKKVIGKKSAKLSLQYASSSPVKMVTPSNNYTDISEISPIKSRLKSSNQKKKGYVSTSQMQGKNHTKSDFELNSLEDFPSMSLSNSGKNPRRIRPTTVAPIKSSVISPKADIATADSFLEESNFESQNFDPSLDKLFLDGKRFSKNQTSPDTMSMHWNSTLSSVDHSHNESDLSSMNGSIYNEVHSKLKTTPTKNQSENIAVERIIDLDIIDFLIEVYICIWFANLIPNVTLEFYFLFITLTIPMKFNQLFNLTHPFRNVESCVYFAAKCLEKLANFISLFNEKLLNLLVSNTRVKSIVSSEFISRVEDIITAEINCSNKKLPMVIKSPMTGIPFQVESDNRKSFACDKHFYTFSKKRDAFYVLVREWQDNCLDPDWNMKQVMSRKVAEIMKMNIEVSTHYQFAKLFVAQLLEMCRNDVGYKPEEPEKSSFLIDLKKQNPSKYHSLQDRLTRPSLTNDPCPKPSFSTVEQFFKDFIDVADGYCFSKILKHVLMSLILEINSNSFGLDLKDTSIVNRSDFVESLWMEIKVAISELRLLAKFLGYIVFLPYNYSSDYIDDKISKTRHLLAEPLDFSDFLFTSYKNHNLLITLPWIVDFFSMADKHSFDHPVYNKNILYLICLYQCNYTRVKSNSLLPLALLLHIGWLFELPHLESMKFYEPDEKMKNIFCRTTNVIGIDDIIAVDKEFLYSLCPYLNDIKKPLVDFAKGVDISMTGSFRKITPVRTSDVFSIDLKSNLKIQLIDSYMRYAPNHVKEVMKFITDRHFTNIKHHVTEVIISECCRKLMENIKEKFRCDENIGGFDVDELKSINSVMYGEHIEMGKEDISSESNAYIEKYLRENVLIAMQSLLPESTHQKVVEVSSKVVKHNIRIKLQEWMTANCALFLNEMNILYRRYVKNVLKVDKDITK